MPADLLEIPCEPANDTIIPVLEEVLAKARAGELSSVALAYVYRDGCTGQKWSHLPSFGTMIGSVATLQHRLIERMIEE